ncbi:MAG TPA: SgcJ/EcaC family oxidoreductase [Ramlibacter sp.]|nr:SgcJ/EcaC family oxidoreductase [Ramlibacter sp.]
MTRTSTSAALLAMAALLAGCASNPQGATSAQGNACKSASEREIAALFDRWNASLQTGDPLKVVANYAPSSVLLATVSNTPRVNAAQKEDYFKHFLENKPSGRIDSRTIEIDCTTALDTGLYTFTFAKTGDVVKARYTYTYKWNGSQWLITSHHSSAMPEK